jgi:hypothetical protein
MKNEKKEEVIINDSKKEVDKVKSDNQEGRRLPEPVDYIEIGHDMQGKCLSDLDKREPEVRKLKFSRD